MALTTLDAVKTANHIAGAGEDAFLNAMWPACEQALKTLLGYNLEQQSYTEFYQGTNTDGLVLRQVPVQPNPTVWQDATGYWGQGANDPFDITGALLKPGVDYYLELDGPNAAYSGSGILRRIGDIWRGTVVQPAGLLGRRPVPGLGNVKVQYLAGWNPVPADSLSPLETLLFTSLGTVQEIVANYKRLVI